MSCREQRTLTNSKFLVFIYNLIRWKSWSWIQFFFFFLFGVLRLLLFATPRCSAEHIRTQTNWAHTVFDALTVVKSWRIHYEHTHWWCGYVRRYSRHTNRDREILRKGNNKMWRFDESKNMYTIAARWIRRVVVVCQVTMIHLHAHTAAITGACETRVFTPERLEHWRTW